MWIEYSACDPHFLRHLLLVRRLHINLFLQFNCLLRSYQCHLCLGFEAIGHALLLPDFDFFHHRLHHVKFALLFEVKVAVRLLFPQKSKK